MELGGRNAWAFKLHIIDSFVHFSLIELAKKYSQVLYQFKTKMSLLFTIVLLTSPSLRSSSAATLGNFMTEELLEPSCRSCGGECRAYDIERDGGRCKCDADCEVYGDCCGQSSTRKSAACKGTPLGDSHLNELQFTCQSIYLDSTIDVMANESFWMVSRCSSDWLSEVGESGQMVLDSCLSESRDLPSVTDPVSGIVYRNQHCALCNRVENTVPWDASIVCTEYLYELLETVPFSELDTSLFRDQCSPCSYQYPRTLPHTPRACYPNVIDTCLNITEFLGISQEVYEGLANDCVNGSYDLQELMPFSFDVIARNRACTECNQGNFS